MSFFSKLFGSQDPEDQKKAKFQEFDRKDDKSKDSISIDKATWLSIRAASFTRKGEIDKAIDDLLEAIDIKQDYFHAYYALATHYAQRERYTDALKLLDEAPKKFKIDGVTIEEEPIFTKYDAYIAIYISKGDYKKARKYVIKALKEMDYPDIEEVGLDKVNELQDLLVELDKKQQVQNHLP